MEKKVLRHLMEPGDFTLEELDELMDLAQRIIGNPEAFAETCKGSILATLFYEPSTRTRLSFEAAMLKLGGSVIGFANPDCSSFAKGETIFDTVRIISGYADIAVIRHPEIMMPQKSIKYSNIPLINAGDGSNQHPTQTLTDLLTIHMMKKRFSNLKIGFCGDLKYGRTVNSLIKAMDRYENNKFVLISPEKLGLSKEIKDELRSPIEEVESLEDNIQDLDILYMTRIQRERFLDKDEYNQHKGCYILDNEKLKSAGKDMIIMHPLPRVDEIKEEVDEDPRAVYFKQAEAGKFIRMALIARLLDKA